jgi:hypothetical protein
MLVIVEERDPPVTGLDELRNDLVGTQALIRNDGAMSTAARLAVEEDGIGRQTVGRVDDTVVHAAVDEVLDLLLDELIDRLLLECQRAFGPRLTTKSR